MNEIIQDCAQPNSNVEQECFPLKAHGLEGPAPAAGVHGGALASEVLPWFRMKHLP